jgi:hypothetical protein
MQYINTYLYKGKFWIPETETIPSSIDAIKEVIYQLDFWKGEDFKYKNTIWIQNGSSKIIDLSDEVEAIQNLDTDLSNDPAYDSWAEIRG